MKKVPAIAGPAPALFGLVLAPGGEQRLGLYYLPRDGATGAYDFHALVWEARADGRWLERRRIGAAGFDGGGARPRWINGLHRFDPARGEAVIRVAEGDRERQAPQLRIHYTWRRWDLLRNTELEKLQLCLRPDSDYEEPPA